ncbi:MAG: hypothetical protein LBL73_08855 [Synergistaceae bacterium]|nr:hypothetical protein [Synergistaceae bacterium]
MPSKKTKDTVTTTIRLETNLRAMLESIAARENRSLTGQMTQFLAASCEQYMSENELSYHPDIQEVGTDAEYAEYMADLSDAAPPKNYWADD